MPAEARVTKIWKNQKLYISIALILFGFYFFVDGKWVWPRSNERWKEHDRLLKEDRIKEWPAIAAQRGWSVKPPEKYHDQGQIFGQFFIGTLLVSLGGTLLLYWLAHRRRIVKSDGEAVYAPNGKRVPFTAITGMGLKDWESKGYARVRYELNGKAGKFTLDDYKFERDPTHEIVREIEEHLGARTTKTDE